MSIALAEPLVEVDIQTRLALARRQLELERRRMELLKENQLEFYCPHAKQADFHAAALYHYRYARTGNRFGKSEMGAAEDVAFAIGYRPWIPEGNPLRTLGIPAHPTKGLIVTTDWDKSEEIFTSFEDGPNLGKLWKYLPKSKLYPDPEHCFTRNHSGSIDKIRVKHISGGVSTINFDTVKSFKQNKLGAESSTWDWIHYDEPPPEERYNADIRGLIDRDGRVWFTCTPLEEPWIDAKFIKDAEQQTMSSLNVAEGDFWMMTGNTDDNPYNTQEAIERVMSQYPEEEQQTRRTGIPRAYFGLVYGNEFDWKAHISKEPPVGWVDWHVPPPNYTIRLAIDYHPRKPHHVLFIATSPFEYQYVYAEVFLSCIMDELFSEIKLVLAGRRPTTPGLIDPLAETENRVTDVSPMDRLMQLGLPLIPATKDPHNGILECKKLLKARDRNGNAILQVNPACRRFVMEISRGYMWDKDTNKPKKDKDDAMENFYRLALQGLSYVEPAEDSDFDLPTAPVDLSNVIIRPDEFGADPFEETEIADRRARYASRYRK